MEALLVGMIATIQLTKRPEVLPKRGCDGFAGGVQRESVLLSAGQDSKGPVLLSSLDALEVVERLVRSTADCVPIRYLPNV